MRELLKPRYLQGHCLDVLEKLLQDQAARF